MVASLFLYPVARCAFFSFVLFSVNIFSDAQESRFFLPKKQLFL